MTETSNWSALQNPVFRKMWIASLLSGTCAAAQDTAATWVDRICDDSIAIFDMSDVDIGVAAFLSAHAACRGPSRLGRSQKVTLRDQSLVGGCGRRPGDTWLAASPQSLHRLSYPVKGGTHA
jgi:Transmembrane secretion effector